ncbi:MAG: putative photosynthetic complex assembly protein PuhE [Pseudomonadota bacterium]
MSAAPVIATLPTVAIAVAAALFLWWFATGILFWMSRRLTGDVAVMGVAGAVLAASLSLVDAVADTASIGAAYLSFLGGIGAWAFAELTFLTGKLTGPVRAPCPPGLGGWRRFRRAIGTLLWHELAILAIAATMLTITWGATNQVGTWAFALLMAMRVSAKLNLFLGVPYPPATLLPGPLAHLDSYFRTRPFTALLPAAVTTGTALATIVAWHAAAPGVSLFEAAGYALLWTLLVLGIVEHWFLILPVREGALWAWFTGLPAQGHSTPAADAGRVKGSTVPGSSGMALHVSSARPKSGTGEMTRTDHAGQPAASTAA